MRPRSTTLALALALALSPLLGGAGALAAAPRATPMARFLVSFDGVKNVRWNEPRWSPRYDCQHIFWGEGNGGERWQVRTPPRKALAWLTSRRLRGARRVSACRLSGETLASRKPCGCCSAAGCQLTPWSWGTERKGCPGQAR